MCGTSPPIPISIIHCYVKLPIDRKYKVSEWQKHEPYSTSCGFGTTTRYRTALQQPNSLLKLCPPLEETTTCINKSCVEIIPGEWTACTVTNATNTNEYCGHGKMFQKYSCYVDGSHMTLLPVTILIHFWHQKIVIYHVQVTVYCQNGVKMIVIVQSVVAVRLVTECLLGKF